jgi:hypothetical protein
VIGVDQGLASLKCGVGFGEEEDLVVVVVVMPETKHTSIVLHCSLQQPPSQDHTISPSATLHVPGLMQSLPKLATWNESLFMVWSRYQDYFYSLYDKQLTISQTKKIVPDVVQAIEDHIVVS